MPLEWATTQNNLGNALTALGERESGTERLEEAVGTYRAALEELTRDRVPLRWSGRQDNLGYALTALGERESGTERLEEAVEAYRTALEERTRDRVAIDWAMTQSNQGCALTASREIGQDRIDNFNRFYSEVVALKSDSRIGYDPLPNLVKVLADR